MKSNNNKYRLILIIIFICIIGGVAYKYNIPITVKTNEKGVHYEDKVITNELVQDIEAEYNKPVNIMLKIGELSNGDNYSIEVKHKNIVIGKTKLQKNTQQECLVNINVDGEKVKKGDKLLLIIKSKETSKLNILTAISDNNFKINNVESNEGIYYAVQYNGFTPVYITVIILLMILAVGTILFFNVKSIHNSMFVLIMILGIMSSILNPVLDIPDEHDHLSRADLASRGYLIMGEDYKDYRLSNTVGYIIQNNWSTFNHSPLTTAKPDWTTESTYYSYANANLFLGYIPQTIGIMLSKVFASNDYVAFLFGRIMNVIMYAVVVRYALKKTPIYKVPLAIVSILPMTLFIVGSYNADATTYALGILAISYFLYLYDKQDISIKDMSIYFIICTVLGVVKLPYCLLIGLLLFIPKDRYKSSKDYYKSIIFIFITAIIALGWAGISVMRTEYSPFQPYFDKNGVNSREQVKFIFNNPIIFIKGFIVSLIRNIPTYVSQLNQFGWLAYSMPRAITYLINAFIVVVLIGYPSQSKLTKKTNIGAFVVSLGVYVATCFTLYITWTTVGADFILGVQGRYFVPIIGLLSILWPYRIKCKEDKKEFVDYIFMCVSVLFSIIYLVIVTNQYY